MLGSGLAIFKIDGQVIEDERLKYKLHEKKSTVVAWYSKKCLEQKQYIFL